MLLERQGIGREIRCRVRLLRGHEKLLSQGVHGDLLGLLFDRGILNGLSLNRARVGRGRLVSAALLDLFQNALELPELFQSRLIIDAGIYQGLGLHRLPLGLNRWLGGLLLLLLLCLSMSLERLLRLWMLLLLLRLRLLYPGRVGSQDHRRTVAIGVRGHDLQFHPGEHDVGRVGHTLQWLPARRVPSSDGILDEIQNVPLRSEVQI